MIQKHEPKPTIVGNMLITKQDKKESKKRVNKIFKIIQKQKQKNI